MDLLTRPENDRAEIEELRRQIRRKANHFGEESFQEADQHTEPVSLEWSDFKDGPVRAKWVPTDEHDCTLILFHVPEGTVIDFHNHRPTESFVVVGDVTVHTPQKEKRLHEGDVLKIEEARPHAAEFHEDTLLTMLWTPAFPGDPESAERVLYRASGIQVDETKPGAQPDQ